ncbi:MAG TPA: glycosyl hydrolase family 18 protein [Acidobacteriaceae bacterium]|nr:glycosyl hydrolase family 18 protein [Acidobacteriaceae bacterium]
MRRRAFLGSSIVAAAGALVAHRASASSNLLDARTRRILYILGQFSAGTSQAMQSAADILGNSSFNVLILAFLQVSAANGKLSLSYNGNAFPALAPQVPALLARLRSSYGGRKRLMISIGGWASAGNFEAIRSFGIPAFVRQLTQEAIMPLGIEGIDLDPEPNQGGMDRWMGMYREYATTLIDLSKEYKRIHPTHLVTHSPIAEVAAEIYASNDGRTNLLQMTRTMHGNNIDWLNVQFYEGGQIENGDIAGFYRDSLAAPLKVRATETGIANPMRFFTPLFEPEAKQPLIFCQQTIAAINRRCADLHTGPLTGAALWDYRQVAPEMGDWSHGLEAALHP